MRGLVDAHSHAHNCVDGSRAVARALATSCSHVLVNATSPSDWAAVKSTCAHFPGRALPQFGVHPWWALDAGAPEGWVPLLAAALRDDAGAGVGEIGLDRSERALERSPLPAQLSALRAQLDLASELRRPVSVHCVRAHALLHEEIKAARARAGALPAAILMHSWSGSPAHASTFKALGVPILFSFAGGLVGAACARLRGDAGRVPGACGRDAVASLLSLASTEIAFETDAPDQSFSHFLSPELKARWGASGDCDSGDWGEGRDVDSGDATDSGAAGGAEGGTPLCCPPPPSLPVRRLTRRPPTQPSPATSLPSYTTSCLLPRCFVHSQMQLPPRLQPPRPLSASAPPRMCERSSFRACRKRPQDSLTKG